MSLPRKLMIDGERTVETTRTHVKRLFLPFLVLLVGFLYLRWVRRRRAA